MAIWNLIKMLKNIMQIITLAIEIGNQETWPQAVENTYRTTGKHTATKATQKEAKKELNKDTMNKKKQGGKHTGRA